MSMKNSNDTIEPANLRLVAQCLNQLRHHVPPILVSVDSKNSHEQIMFYIYSPVISYFSLLYLFPYILIHLFLHCFSILSTVPFFLPSVFHSLKLFMFGTSFLPVFVSLFLLL